MIQGLLEAEGGAVSAADLAKLKEQLSVAKKETIQTKQKAVAKIKDLQAQLAAKDERIRELVAQAESAGSPQPEGVPDNLLKYAQTLQQREDAVAAREQALQGWQEQVLSGLGEINRNLGVGGVSVK